VVLFLGDTSTGHKPGKFTNFQLTGSTGIFTTGFYTEFVARAWDLTLDAAAERSWSPPSPGPASSGGSTGGWVGSSPP
jgi:hypothetical protein